jgi:hypothetical protein
MRPLLAAAFLCAPVALTGCLSTTTGTTPPSGQCQYLQHPPQYFPPSPPTPNASPSTTVAQEAPPATVVPAVALVQAPAADEVAEALKEYEDALATLRTAQRALEASHKKLQALAKRAPQGCGATPALSLPGPLPFAPAPTLVAPLGPPQAAPAPTSAAPVRVPAPAQAPLPSGGILPPAPGPMPSGVLPAPAQAPMPTGAGAPVGVPETTESRKVTVSEPSSPRGSRGLFRSLGDWLRGKSRLADNPSLAAKE